MEPGRAPELPGSGALSEFFSYWALTPDQSHLRARMISEGRQAAPLCGSWKACPAGSPEARLLAGTASSWRRWGAPLPTRTATTASSWPAGGRSREAPGGRRHSAVSTLVQGAPPWHPSCLLQEVCGGTRPALHPTESLAHLLQSLPGRSRPPSATPAARAARSCPWRVYASDLWCL